MRTVKVDQSVAVAPVLSTKFGSTRSARNQNSTKQILQLTRSLWSPLTNPIVPIFSSIAPSYAPVHQTGGGLPMKKGILCIFYSLNNPEGSVGAQGRFVACDSKRRWCALVGLSSSPVRGCQRQHLNTDAPTFTIKYNYENMPHKFAF